jgi:peptide/nickel transport system permease protein
MTPAGLRTADRDLGVEPASANSPSNPIPARGSADTAQISAPALPVQVSRETPHIPRSRSSSKFLKVAVSVLRRLLRAFALLLAVIVVSFGLIQAAPGSVIDILTSEMQIGDAEQIEEMKAMYGLDQPAIVQLLKYIWAVLHLDLGFSYRQNVPVLDAILDRLPATMLLMVTGISIAVLFGVTAGAIAAVRRNTIVDHFISLVAIFLFAAPTFWLGIMATVVFSIHLGWLPVGDMQTIGLSGGPLAKALDIGWHLILPATALGLFGQAAMYMRVTRAAMIDVAALDFVRTARAKGLSDTRVTIHHILRNALLPVVTLLGLQFGSMLSGSVVIETVFDWPGIGILLFDAVMNRDYPVVLGVLLLGSALVVTVNIVVDLLYAWLDPRVEVR